jgi:hypothetical protein
MPSLELFLKIFYSLLALFFAVAIFSLLIFASNRLLRVRLERKHTVRLENRGNCRSMYYLNVSSLEPSLRFALFAQGVPLVEVRDVDEEQIPAFLPDSTVAVSPAPAAVKKAGTTSGPASVNTAAAVKAGQATAAKAGTVASLLGSLGRLLPGSLGAGLRAQSAQARELQTGTSRAIQAPQAIKSQVGSVQKESGKLAGAKPTASRPAASSPAQASHSKPATRTLNAPTGSGAPAPSRVHLTSVGAAYRVRLPELEPGQSFDLTLQIGIRGKRYPAGSFPYVLESEQIALDFPDLAGKPLQRSGVIYFQPVRAWRYWLPTFSAILLVLLGVASLVYAYLLIWR